MCIVMLYSLKLKRCQKEMHHSRTNYCSTLELHLSFYSKYIKSRIICNTSKICISKTRGARAVTSSVIMKYCIKKPTMEDGEPMPQQYIMSPHLQVETMVMALVAGSTCAHRVKIHNLIRDLTSNKNKGS